MKQHTSPVIIEGNKTHSLKRVSFDSKDFNEGWIQEICFENTGIIPFDEIEPTFEGMIPICRELSTSAGYVDLIYMNEYGFIAIGECKLWRNPEARRKVVGQVLDYAKDLSQWDYSTFEKECLNARKDGSESLFSILSKFYPDLDEPRFIDNVQRNLEKGRFLLTVIGDGIRGNMEELSSYINRNTNLGFTLALIELPVYKNEESGTLVITPRVLAKTLEIERVVVKFSDTDIQIKETQEKEIGQSISEKVYYERLAESVGADEGLRFKNFIETLKSKYNILPKLGRGKRMSLNIKSPNDTYNFGSVLETGEVWFYGIVNKTEQLGDQEIGVNYLRQLAELVGGVFDDSYAKWSWTVKKDGNYVLLNEYLKKTGEWVHLIGETLDEIRQLEENSD